MEYLTFHIREEATEMIKEFLREEDGVADGQPVFIFAPAEVGCELTVGIEGREALSLVVDHCIHVEEDPLAPEQAMRWRTPQYHGARPEEDTGIGVKEIVFWIDGTAMAWLLEMGWTAARFDEFDYRFRPDENSVAIWAKERSGSDAVELSAGLD